MEIEVSKNVKAFLVYTIYFEAKLQSYSLFIRDRLASTGGKVELIFEKRKSLLDRADYSNFFYG